MFDLKNPKFDPADLAPEVRNAVCVDGVTHDFTMPGHSTIEYVVLKTTKNASTWVTAGKKDRSNETLRVRRLAVASVGYKHVVGKLHDHKCWKCGLVVTVEDARTQKSYVAGASKPMKLPRLAAPKARAVKPTREPKRRKVGGLTLEVIQARLSNAAHKAWETRRARAAAAAEAKGAA